jgi:hypothetical protein
VPPYQQGSCGTGSVSVVMQEIRALSGTEGVVWGMNMIKDFKWYKRCFSEHTSDQGIK